MDLLSFAVSGALAVGALLMIGAIVVAAVRAHDRERRAMKERERREAEHEQRGQAALDALRDLGRDYPRRRPKDY